MVPGGWRSRLWRSIPCVVAVARPRGDSVGAGPASEPGDRPWICVSGAPVRSM